MSSSMAKAVSRFLSSILMLVLIPAATGCTMFDSSLFDFSHWKIPSAPPEEQEPVAVAQEGLAEDVPFRLEVTDELNDGEKLIVRGRVVAKANWELSKAVVRLSGMTDSGEVRNSYFPLAASKVDRVAGVPIEAKASMRVELPAGEKIEFSLELPAEGLDSYQLELLWGAEAEPVLKRVSIPKGPAYVALRNLEVQLVRSLTCDYIPCPSTYQLTGELYNSGGSTIKKVIIGAGFILTDGKRGKLALSDQIPENEQRIEVQNIRLSPGEGKAVKIVLDQPILESEGIVKPVIRIVSFEAE